MKKGYRKKCSSCFGEGKRRYQGCAAIESCNECGGTGMASDECRIKKENDRQRSLFLEKLKLTE
jgi:hypothetical protein